MELSLNNQKIIRIQRYQNKINSYSENRISLYIPTQGYFEYISGKKADLNLNAYATMPIDKADF